MVNVLYTCWILELEKKDYFTYTEVKRIFRCKPTMEQLSEALLNEELEITYCISRLKEPSKLAEVIKDLLNFGDYECVLLYEQAMF